MADMAENSTYEDAETAISQGKRHLLVQDYTAAVTALAEGLEMMSQKLGDCADELGEPYLLYGRALLGLAREEVGVLGGGVPGSEDTEDDEDCDDDDENDEKTSDKDENESEIDDKESNEKRDKKNIVEGLNIEKNIIDAEKRDNSVVEDEKNNKSIDVIEEKKKDKNNVEDEKKDEKKKNVIEEENKIIAIKQESSTSSSISTDNEKIIAPVSNKTDDKKIEEIKMIVDDEKVSTKNETNDDNVVVAGTSKESMKNNKNESKSKILNGTKAGKSTDNPDETDDVNKDEEDEDPGRGIDLQVAWEVLELAKIVFTKRGDKGMKYLAETHRLLGEVAMESDNPQGAITDLEGAMEILKKLEPSEPRAIADIHYQLGLAHSMANDFDASIQEFFEAMKLLAARIKQLEDIRESTKTMTTSTTTTTTETAETTTTTTTTMMMMADNPFYTIEGEIKELRELLPAISEKIIDMKDFKDEACRLVIEGIKNKVATGGCTNGGSVADPVASSSSTSSFVDKNDASSSITEQSGVSTKNLKPASDISHLVRKKRKNDNETEETEIMPTCKKSAP